MIDTETAVTAVGVILAVMPHVAALFGVPTWIAKIGAVQSIYEIICGNYRKAKSQK